MEVKIEYMPKDKTGKNEGYFQITCGEISACGKSLEHTIQEFDTKFERHIRLGNTKPVKQKTKPTVAITEPEFTIVEVSEHNEPERKRVCCNCGNNQRIKDESGMVKECRCIIDGHYISYIACFEHWCNRWRKEKET